jgi:hypothetical protein
VVQTPHGQIGHVALLFIARPRRRRRPRPPDASPAIPPRVRRHQSFSARLDPVSARRASSLGFVAQPSNPVGFAVNCHKPRVQTPVVSRYPALAPINDFVLLFLPPCGPHLTPLATRSLESGLLVSPLLGAPQGIELSHPLFTCTSVNQAATCTCNTRPRLSPHHVVNHSSQTGATNHRSLDAPVLSSKERWRIKLMINKTKN